MQDPTLCKKLIEIILSDTIGKITYISVQHNIKTYEQAKSVRLDILVQTVKQNEQARQEYRLLSTFEMDIKDNAKRETARLMKMEKLDISLIKKITGLSETEIEKL